MFNTCRSHQVRRAVGTWLVRPVSVLMPMLVLVLMLGLASCTPGGTPTPTSISPTLTPTPLGPGAVATDTPTSVPTLVPTDTPEPTPVPTETPTPRPTADLKAFQWKQVGLAGNNVLGMALHAGGANLVLAAGMNEAWLSHYDYTQWDRLNVNLNVQGRIASVAVGDARTMYIASHTGCASGLPSARFRSTDGGQTWQPMAGEALYIAAANGGIAYASTCNQVIKTTDAGANWAPLPGTHIENYDPHSLAVSPDGQKVFVAYSSEGGTGRIMRSTDGGSSWAEITPRNAPDGVLTAPSNLTYVPGSVGRPDDGGLYMTSYHAFWWLPVDSDDWQVVPYDDASPFGGEYFFTALYIDTAYTEEYNKPGPVIYAARSKPGEGEADERVFRSTDKGKSWQAFGTGLEGRMVRSLLLAPHDTSVDPGMVETLLAATDDGVWAIPIPPPFPR